MRPLSARTQTRLRTGASALLITVFGLLATGCGTKPTTSTTIPIRIWRINQDVDPIRDVLTQFMRSNTNVQITYKKNVLDGYELASLQSLAARTGPDIWSFPNDWMGDHQDSLTPVPANYFFPDKAKTGPDPVTAVKSLFPPGIAEQLIGTDNQVYGIPTNVDTLQLYYNSDLFSTALSDFRKSMGTNYSDSVYQPVRQLLSKQPPATWSDLVQQTKYLTQRSGTTINRSAIALGTADNIPQAEDTLQLLMLQNGVQVVSSDRTRALFGAQVVPASGGNPIRPGQDALDFFTSFANPNKDTYSWNASMPAALDAFAQGKVAMVIAYSDFGQQLKVKYPRFSFQVGAIPQVSTDPAQAPVNFANYTIETVPKVASNTTVAFNVLKAYSDSSDSHSLANEQKLKSPYLATLQKNTGDWATNQVITARSVFKKNRPAFDLAFHDMIVAVSQNGDSSSTALDVAVQKINNILTPPISTPTPTDNIH